MDIQLNSKILGAFVVGIALIAGAYLANNFGKTSARYAVVEKTVTAPVTVTRNAIAVLDEDNNGIEDWRDDFITTEPIVLDKDDGVEYVSPDTLTGKTGINLVQDLIRARGYGDFGQSNDEIVSNTVEELQEETGFTIYDTPDIIIQPQWTDEDIKNYANAVAKAVLVDTVTNNDHELLILQDIMNRNDDSRIGELEELSMIYSIARDTTLTIPVPAFLAKEHLDLINTLHAVQKDIEGMTYAFSDPVYSLLRLKRYEEDTIGLSLALQNIYKSLVPYASLFTAKDSAVLFGSFGTINNQKI